MKNTLAVSEKKDISLHVNFSTKLKDLKFYREVLRDGNCLYLSIAVQSLTFFRTHKSKLDKLENFLDIFCSNCKKLNIDEFIYTDNIDTFNMLIKNDIKVENIEISSWFEIIFLFRLAISSHIRLHSDEYQPFILDMKVEKYCKNFIEPFYVEAGYIEIGALVNILPISIQVYDITENNETCSRIYGTHKEYITILHTFNHFEPVYYN